MADSLNAKATAPGRLAIRSGGNAFKNYVVVPDGTEIDHKDSVVLIEDERWIVVDGFLFCTGAFYNTLRTRGLK